MSSELIHAAARWDVIQSCEMGRVIQRIDPDLGRPGWCWNSAIMVTCCCGNSGARYVEGWLHNRNPFASKRRYPHGWTVLPDGTIIDTCSGADSPSPHARAAAAFVFYEPVHLWTVDELMEVLESDPTPPLTEEYRGWRP